MEKTLSYSEQAQGWTSFFSYIPDMMIGMNSYFYSFKNGELYKHNTNASRNTFYKEWFDKINQPLLAYNPSTVTAVFNVEPLTVKNFKTIATYGSSSWDCTVTTDLSTGFMDSSYFEEKEGNWFAYIRNNSGDENLKLRSAQGVGSVTTVLNPGTNNTKLQFNFNIGTIASVGDMMYKNNAGNIQPIGQILSIAPKEITINNSVPGLYTPVNGDYILYIKNSVAESNGARGYYMQYRLENYSTSRVELFSVKSNIFKSYP